MSSVSTLAPRARRRMSPTEPPDPVTQYALDVIAGRIVAGGLIVKACERHIADLANGHERGLSWHPDLAVRAIAFAALLQHYKGEWGAYPGHPVAEYIVLEPWECFVVGSLMGWLRADGTRRFRELYLEVARKNGKTLLAAILVLLLTFFDGEPGAEAYAIATKRDQAKLVWNDVKRMIERNPQLSAKLKTYALSIADETTASFFRPLGEDSGETDIGTNPYVAVVDELHVLADRDGLTSMRTGMSARRQPVLIKITTAGKLRESIWFEERTDAVNVVEGRATDDSLLALIYTLDEGDDPFDEAVWPKANPNLGVSVKVDFLREIAAKAARSPGVLTGYLQLHMNVPTQVSTRAISLAEWDACAEDPVVPEDATVYGGLDLASVQDLTAFVYVHRDEDGYVNVLCEFWCPERGVDQRSRMDAVPYADWVRDGYLTATPGPTTDYEYVFERINALRDGFTIDEVGYDRWNASQLVTNLSGEGAQMIAVSQTHAGLAAGWRELERLVLERKLRHGGNPILRWMAGNVEVETDSAGNQKPSKAHSTEKVDGIVALTMAVGRMIVHAESSAEPAVIMGRAR